MNGWLVFTDFGLLGAKTSLECHPGERGAGTPGWLTGWDPGQKASTPPCC